MNAIAIIPARGGSQRIPRKNLIDLGGRPLIAWTINAALEADCFANVIVSTDDEEIAEAARSVGAEVPFLRPQYADGFSPASDATRLALKQAEAWSEARYDVVCQLMATTPFRTASDIHKAMSEFAASGAPAQLSCVGFDWLNPWWAVTLDDGRRPKPLFPDKRFARSQDLEPVYAPSGAIWIAQCEVLRKECTFYAKDHRYCPISWRSGLDIDTPEDLELARQLLRGDDTA
ncbi:MAG: acylneuraminate cytidylyltransferase family protein [Pseudomonadota bacterium]